MAHVGKATKVLHPVLEGIHITIENVTGKTGDAYVEMVGMKDAMDHVERFRKRQMEGHVDRLGDRPVEMEISSPDALLQAVFKAGSTGVEWRGGNPTIRDPPLGQTYGHFKTFVPTEDLTMLLKHAETQVCFIFLHLALSFVVSLVFFSSSLVVSSIPIGCTCILLTLPIHRRPSASSAPSAPTSA